MVDAHPNVEFVGEINEREKAEFLGEAAALLFPIDWPEPFGIVMIEAMACGTPVIAFPAGSAPEVIDDGVSGWLVDDVDEAVRAVRRVERFDRSEGASVLRAALHDRPRRPRLCGHLPRPVRACASRARAGPPPARPGGERRSLRRSASSARSRVRVQSPRLPWSDVPARPRAAAKD